MPAKLLFSFLLTASLCLFSHPVSANPVSNDKVFQQYISYFQKVYDIFDQNYYLPPDHKVYDDFIKKFTSKIYPQLKGEGKSDDYVRWRSAWFLVESLHSKDDRFTQFYPPKPAVKFKQIAMAQRIDLGIEGKKNNIGFLVTRLEPHADAYDKGLREDDILLQIDGKNLMGMTDDVVNSKLNPVANTHVKLMYISNETKTQNTIEVVSKEYFKQTVFLTPVPVPGVYCLEITNFNEMTPQDLGNYMAIIEQNNAKGLVIDLRGNPGGQVLGALYISSYFLKSGDEFAYFQHRTDPKSEMDVPGIVPDVDKFSAPMVILVDNDTGSCAELFAGIMQFKKRAIVLGVNTAGQILLKSMFPVGDGSMVALVKARGYYPDGTVFGFDGITPNKIIMNAPKDGLINLAAALISMETRGN